MLVGEPSSPAGISISTTCGRERRAVPQRSVLALAGFGGLLSKVQGQQTNSSLLVAPPVTWIFEKRLEVRQPQGRRLVGRHVLEPHRTPFEQLIDIQHLSDWGNQRHRMRGEHGLAGTVAMV